MVNAPYQILAIYAFYFSDKLYKTKLALTVETLPVGQSMTAQRLLLDTESTTIAFCNKTLKSARSEQTNLMACHKQEISGQTAGWAGYIHSGKIEATNNIGSTITLSSTHFAIMEKDSDEPCVEGVEGK